MFRTHHAPTHSTSAWALAVLALLALLASPFVGGTSLSLAALVCLAGVLGFAVGAGETAGARAPAFARAESKMEYLEAFARAYDRFDDVAALRLHDAVARLRTPVQR